MKFTISLITALLLLCSIACTFFFYGEVKYNEGMEKAYCLVGAEMYSKIYLELENISVNKALNICNDYGGGTIHFGPGEYMFNSIEKGIYSNVTLKGFSRRSTTLKVEK